MLCLLDIGAMDSVADWLTRARPCEARDGDLDSLDALWLRLGALARAALGGDDTAAKACAWLQAQLRPLGSTLAADERVLAAQVLINYHFLHQRFEQLDLIAAAVEDPASFERATPLSRARWLYTLGFGHYQIGQPERAEPAWQRALALAAAHGLPNTRLMVSLAMLRLLLDRGRLDEARCIEQAIRPEWGAGRAAQLIHLQQMRGRLQLLAGQPVRALATLREALALAEHGGLSPSERASCLTDLAQALIATQREDEAAELLARLAAEHRGRDAEVYRCLHALLAAARAPDHDEAAGRAQLADALARAQRVRYTMFFRLLPALAAQLCALALRWGIEPVFAAEIVRARSLRAPPDADAHWPWGLWLRMLGGFELRRDGAPLQRAGKQQQKPLELLRLLACERTLAIGMQAAADALWPDADGAAARKSLEMTVQRLRRLLGDDSLVRVGDGRVGLDAARASSDVVQRRVLIERLEALAMQPPAQPHEGAALAARIAQLSQGMLLPGAPDSAWLEAERERCVRELERAALAAAAVLERSGATPAARELAQAALLSRRGRS